MHDVLSNEVEIAFPESVKQFFRGDLGQPPFGFPAQLQNKVLKGEPAIECRPGALLGPVDMKAKQMEIEQKLGSRISDEELNSYLMYPEVFHDYALFKRKYGSVSKLPTSVFFYGLAPGESISVEIDQGKMLDISCVAIGNPDDKAMRDVFFVLNGQARTVQIEDFSVEHNLSVQKKADPNDPTHIGAPLPGIIGTLNVCEGQFIEEGDLLLTIEAMKMETSVFANKDCTILKIHALVGDEVKNMSLIIEIDDDTANDS